MTPAMVDSNTYGRRRAVTPAATHPAEPVRSNSTTLTATVPSVCPEPETA
jgi:hypothetical protein